MINYSERDRGVGDLDTHRERERNEYEKSRDM